MSATKTAQRPAARPAEPRAPAAAETSAPAGAATEGPPPVAITPEAGALLLRLARAVVDATASGRIRTADLSSFLPREPPPVLLAPSAAFVTLHEEGELRGCIGSLGTDRPLWMTVVSAAVAAASRDPRFIPVAASEVPALSIDVSVLGQPVPLQDPSVFQPGIDGVIVERGGRRGLLLPEVATDAGWGTREMLEGTCRKAGLPHDAWRDPGTHVFVFRTARVSEADDAG
jgi:AmmeMemoRadiSam system protein A